MIFYVYLFSLIFTLLSFKKTNDYVWNLTQIYYQQNHKKIYTINTNYLKKIYL